MDLKRLGHVFWDALQGRETVPTMKAKAGIQTKADVPAVEGKAGPYVLMPPEHFLSGMYWFSTTDSEDPWEEFSTLEFLEIYALNAVVYACCNMIATSYAEPPLELGREKSNGEWMVRKNEPVTQLMKHPNDWYSFNDLEQITMKRKLLTGAGFIWKWRNNAGEVNELWPIPTHWVKIALGAAGIDHFELCRGDGKEPVIVPAEDMIYDRFPAPWDIFGYVGPLQAACHDYQIDKRRELFTFNMIKNLTLPGLTLTQNAPDGVRRSGLSAEQKTEMRESLADTGTGGTAIFPPGVKPEFPGAIKDIDWSSTEGTAASRICMAFGVPPILIGARIGLEHATYSNYAAAKRSFYDETLKPLWSQGQEVWTRSMIIIEQLQLPPRASSWEFRFDLSDIPELQEDKNEKMDRGLKALSGGAVTVNEFRRDFTNLDDAIDGDVYLRATNIIVEPLGTSLERDEPEQPDEAEPEQEPDDTEESQEDE